MEPLDAQEREFARILRALPGGEPPMALDARSEEHTSELQSPC